MILKVMIFILSGAIFLTLTGCATPELMEVGHCKEVASKYNEARMTKDSIVIGFDAKVLSSSNEVKQEKRWVEIPMDLIIHPDEARGSVYWLTNLKNHTGRLPDKFATSKDLPILHLVSGQELASQRPATQNMIITYVKQDGDSEDFYFMGPGPDGRELYSHFYTSRDTRNPWAYFLIIPALPFTLVYDSVVFLVASISGIDTR